MLSLLDFSLEHTCALWLVETSDFQNLSRVEVRVRSSAHDRDIATYHLVYGSVEQKDDKISKTGVADRQIHTLHCNRGRRKEHRCQHGRYVPTKATHVSLSLTCM